MRVTWGVSSAYGLLTVLSLSVSALAQVEYEYDALGRLISVTHGDGTRTRYTYDAAGNRSQKEISVGSAPSNSNPVAVDDTLSLDEETSEALAVLTNDSDTDGHSLKITSVTNGARGTASVITKSLRVRYTGNVDAFGTDSFTYTVSDGHGGSATATVNVNITNVNDAPVAADDNVNVAQDSSVTFSPLGNDTDVDGDPLNIVSVTGGVNGTASIVNSDTEIQYTPNAGISGSDTLKYTISDGNLTAEANVAVTIDPPPPPPNSPPTANDDSTSLPAFMTSVLIYPLANDSDPDIGDTLTILSVSTPQDGAATIGPNLQSITYTVTTWPIPQSGSDSFTYTITDASGATDTATITVGFNGDGIE